MTLHPTYSNKFTTIAWILITMPFLVSSSGRAKTCPGGLKCHHGGKCKTGDKDWSKEKFPVNRDIPWMTETNVNGEYCSGCKDGWTGLDCKKRYKLCSPDDPDAPTCFHGADCYKLEINRRTGKYDYMCDCTSATDEGGFRYAGEFCQHVEEIQCDEEMFCTNGGKCLSIKDPHSRKHSHFVCKCPPKRIGTHCEFSDEHHFEDCKLECEHGECAEGFKSYDRLISSGPFPAQLSSDLISANGEHCVCPDGYTGLTCEIPVMRCGANKYCYHGSTCVYDQTGAPFCDCNTANTDDKSYAGLSCEHESTSYCEPALDQDQKDSFCANGGTCIEDSDRKHHGCICPEGWTGDLCEIKGEVEPDCDLDCKNGGSCRYGVKGYKDSYEDLQLPFQQVKQENGMYCSCPKGFTGLKCEIDISHCHVGSSQEHFCLHGTPCVPGDPDFDGVVKRFGCDCDETKNEITQMVAGRFCEYAVTEFCSKDQARHSHSFCTNGGKCKDLVEHDDNKHHGCCCPPGFEGDHCHLPEGTLKPGSPITWLTFEECNISLTAGSPPSPPSVASKSKGKGFGKSNTSQEGDENGDSGSENKSANNSAANPSAKAAMISGLIASILVSVLIVYRFVRRPKVEEVHEFDSHSVWPPQNYSDNNSPEFTRTWKYPADHSGTWEYSKEHGNLNNVVI